MKVNLINLNAISIKKGSFIKCSEKDDYNGGNEIYFITVKDIKKVDNDKKVEVILERKYPSGYIEKSSYSSVTSDDNENYDVYTSQCEKTIRYS